MLDGHDNVKCHSQMCTKKDEYHLLTACSAYKVIRKKYDDVLYDNVSVILKYACIIFTYSNMSSNPRS